jgi:ribosomal protein L37AE/L43A
LPARYNVNCDFWDSILSIGGEMKLSDLRTALVVTSNTSDYRKWVGNVGYDDELGLVYDYDDSVANWHKINLGSILFISRNGYLIGVGLVHEIAAEQKEKELFSCPKCERQTLSEKSGNLFYCTKCKATMSKEDRRRTTKSVTRIQARYEKVWYPAKREVTAIEILDLLRTRDTQGAIREVAPTKTPELCGLLDIAYGQVELPRAEIS